MNMTREQFELHFARMQASWELDDMGLNAEEKELMRRYCMGEISRADYDTALLERVKQKQTEVDESIQAAMRVLAVHHIKRLHKEGSEE